MNDVFRDIRSHASINVFITEYWNKSKKNYDTLLYWIQEYVLNKKRILKIECHSQWFFRIEHYRCNEIIMSLFEINNFFLLFKWLYQLITVPDLLQNQYKTKLIFLFNFNSKEMWPILIF